MTDILVTAELHHLSDTGEWEASAYGGPDIINPVDVRIRRDTREQAETDFIEAWNTAVGAEYSPEEFSFVVQSRSTP